MGGTMETNLANAMLAENIDETIIAIILFGHVDFSDLVYDLNEDIQLLELNGNKITYIDNNRAGEEDYEYTTATLDEIDSDILYSIGVAILNDCPNHEYITAIFRTDDKQLALYDDGSIMEYNNTIDAYYDARGGGLDIIFVIPTTIQKDKEQINNWEYSQFK